MHASPFSGPRRAVAVAMALLAAFAVLASLGTGAADARKKAKPAKVSLKVTTKNQAALLSTGKLTVKVTSTGKAKVRLSAKKGKRGGLVKAKAVRFKKNRKQAKRVKLTLTRRGRSTLGACGAQKVRVLGKYTKKVKKKGKLRKRKATARRAKKLASAPSRCNPSPNPNPNPPAPNPVTPAKSICDPLDPKVCMQPWPSNFYTVDDSSTETGKRLNIPREATPANTSGVHIDTTDINRGDGFSVGNLITVKIPEVDTPAAFDNSGLVPIDDLEAYAAPGQAAVVIDTATGERHPIWAELDSGPTTGPFEEYIPGQAPVPVPETSINNNPSNTEDVNLIIRPAKNWEPGHTYVVALRNLKDENGQAVEAAAPFKACRDGAEITDPALLFRCDQLKGSVFPALEQNGISKDGLYLAWDFTVASEENTTGRALEIRDDAFERLGDTNLADRVIQGDTPSWSIDSVNDYTVAQNASTIREVNGTITDIPCYLSDAPPMGDDNPTGDPCWTGAKFAFDANDDLTWNPGATTSAPFRCRIPRSVTAAAGTVTPARTGIYGHGLLGRYTQVNGQDQLGNRQNVIWCAVDWAGFSTVDAPSVVASLGDLSNFNKLTDRMQQGFVNFMYLQRALVHPDGLANDPAFQLDNGGGDQSTIDTSGGDDQRGLYMGISQGGIMGAALTALLPDSDAGVLGVPGINYSTLLSRSVDFDEYAHGVLEGIYLPNVGLYDNYTDLAERPLIFSLMQLLWDRGEGNGYVHSLNPANGPLPDTPAHTVLLQPAIGDHQVANIAAEVEARTIDAALYSPTLNPGRHWSDSFMDIRLEEPPIEQQNIMVYYDGGPVDYVGTRGQGSAVAPNENVPPRPQWGYGGDPHGYPRASEDGMNHAETFLDGDGVGPCQDASGYCYSNGWTGP